MCDPVTIATTAMGIGKSAFENISVNQTLDSQAEGVVNQVGRNDAEIAYEQRKQAEAAVDAGFIADTNRVKAIGAAKVRNASLGIRGVTAQEVVAEQDQIGQFNIATAQDQRRNADTAYTLSTKQTRAHAQDQLTSIEAQRPTAFESIMTMAAGGLQGYLTGAKVHEVLKPENLAAGSR